MTDGELAGRTALVTGGTAGIGFVACLAAFLLAFIPPEGFTAFPPAAYPWVVGAVIVVLGAPPLRFYAIRRPSWDRRPPDGSLLSDAHPEATVSPEGR